MEIYSRTGASVQLDVASDLLLFGLVDLGRIYSSFTNYLNYPEVSTKLFFIRIHL
ncbi:hypothetical protein LguiB_025253 [Lonicera macranthoides]